MIKAFEFATKNSQPQNLSERKKNKSREKKVQKVLRYLPENKKYGFGKK